MDDYPAGSLDHSVPFLLALGTSATATYDSGLNATLKEQAILIRSELPPLDTDQAHALLRYIQSRDATNLPCNARDAPTKHRFRVKTAERVGSSNWLSRPRHLPTLVTCAVISCVLMRRVHSQYSYHPAVHAFPMVSKPPPQMSSSTLPTLR